ncbi:MAG: hypothetical protein U0992_06850 [Planctomycetaceae bacterium]
MHLNHPNYTYGVTAEELMRVVGENFFEVYNGSPTVANCGDVHHVDTDHIWDVVLTFRISNLKLPLMYGLACDDSHDYHDLPNREANPGRGWVEVLASELTPEALLAALETGRFYASSGVRIAEVSANSRFCRSSSRRSPAWNTRSISSARAPGFDAAARRGRQ